MVKAALNAIEAGNTRLGYSILYAHALFMNAMDLVDFLHKILRIVGKGIKATFKSMRPIYRMIQKVASDVKKQRKKNGLHLEGFNPPGLPGVGLVFDGYTQSDVQPLTDTADQTKTTTITTTNEQSMAASKRKALVSPPLKSAPVTLFRPELWPRLRITAPFEPNFNHQAVRPRAPAIFSPSGPPRVFGQSIFGQRAYVSQQWPQGQLGRPVPLVRYSRSDVPTHPEDKSTTDQLTLPSPEAAKVPLDCDPAISIHPTTPGPEITMTRPHTKHDLAVDKQVKSQIQAAIRAENRMIDAENRIIDVHDRIIDSNNQMEGIEPSEAANSLRAIRGHRMDRDRHARQVLIHLNSAKNDSKLLPEDWMFMPLEMFMGTKDRVGRSRMEKWGACL